jgi:hypothetical protein
MLMLAQIADESKGYHQPFHSLASGQFTSNLGRLTERNDVGSLMSLVHSGTHHN